MKSSVVVVFLALVSGIAASASSQDAPTPAPTDKRQVRILVNGSYNATDLSFSENSTFDSFLEEGRSRRDYTGGQGFVVEAGAIVSVWKELGILGSVEVYQSDLDATFEETLPHPLYFDEPRTATGDLTGLSYDEKAVHVDAVYTRVFPSFTLDIFGGGTFFFTSTEIVDAVEIASVYPFDEVAVTETSTVKLDENPIGFNFGGAVTWRVNETVGIAVQARYSAATVRGNREGGNEIQFDAGGFRVGGGIRIAF